MPFIVHAGCDLDLRKFPFLRLRLGELEKSMPALSIRGSLHEIKRDGATAAGE